MIGILDKYIIKSLLKTFMVTIVLFTIIILVFDIAEKLDDFMNSKATIYDIIFKYYLNFTISMLNTFSPIFVFISTLYFVSRLASRTEFISMLVGGMSLMRILRPFMITAAIIGLMSYLLSAWVLPLGDKKRVEFNEQFIKDYWTKTKGNIYRQLKPELLMGMQYFDLNDSTGGSIYLQQYKKNTVKIQSTLYGKYIRWNKELKKWRLEDAQIRKFNTDGTQELVEYKYLDTNIAFDPRQFFFSIEDVTSLNDAELQQLISQEKKRSGNYTATLETEKHRRWASPFSTFLLIAIGVFVAGKKTRGGVGLSLAVGIFVIIFFLFFSKFFVSYGNTGGLKPWIASWALIALFIPVAFGFYRIAQK